MRQLWWLAVLTVAVSVATPAPAATECRVSKPSGGSYWSWRSVDGRRCWYPGSRGRSKAGLFWPSAAHAALARQPEPSPPRDLVRELMIAPPLQRAPELEPSPVQPEPAPIPEPDPEPPPEQFAVRWPPIGPMPVLVERIQPPIIPRPPMWPIFLILVPFVLASWSIFRAGRIPAIAHHQRSRIMNEQQRPRVRDPIFNAENLAIPDHEVARRMNHGVPPTQPLPQREEFPTVQSAAAQSTLLAAKKLIEESRAAITAAKGALEQLEHEQQQYEAAILAYAKSHAEQVTSYLDRCQSAANSMQTHRESMMTLAADVANGGQPVGEQQ